MSRRPTDPSRREAMLGALLAATGALGLSRLALAQDEPAPEPEPEPAPVGDPTELVLLLHPGVPAELIQRSLVAGLYQNRRQSWARGLSAVPFLRPMDSPMTEAFLEQVIGKSRTSFEGAWQSIELSGQGIRPKELVSIDDALERVRATEGGVTYAFRGELVSGPPEGITVLAAPRKAGR